jgi:hypothetical protein
LNPTFTNRILILKQKKYKPLSVVTVAVATNARRIFQKLLEKNVKASNGRAKVLSLITIFKTESRVNTRLK